MNLFGRTLTSLAGSARILRRPKIGGRSHVGQKLQAQSSA
jgi:hypothetical protein